MGKYQSMHDLVTVQTKFSLNSNAQLL